MYELKNPTRECKRERNCIGFESKKFEGFEGTYFDTHEIEAPDKHYYDKYPEGRPKNQLTLHVIRHLFHLTSSHGMEEAS